MKEGLSIKNSKLIFIMIIAITTIILGGYVLYAHIYTGVNAHQFEDNSPKYIQELEIKELIRERLKDYIEDTWVSSKYEDDKFDRVVCVIIYNQNVPEKEKEELLDDISSQFNIDKEVIDLDYLSSDELSTSGH
jgi:hypothetical protein